jgi:hypothetical protein
MEKDEKHQMFISLQPSDSRRSGAPKWTILEPQRPRTRLTALHKLFWVALRTFWPAWRKPLVSMANY